MPPPQPKSEKAALFAATDNRRLRRSAPTTLYATVVLLLVGLVFVYLKPDEISALIWMPVPASTPAPASSPVLASTSAPASTSGLASPTSPPVTAKDQYIDGILNNATEYLANPDPLRKLCSRPHYQKGLVWNCGDIEGNVVDVRNFWMTCTRNAIEAGATTLILPRLTGNTHKDAQLQDLFDVDYFLQTWDTVCPQILAVVDHQDGFPPNLPPPSSERSPHLKLETSNAFPHDFESDGLTSNWRETFDQWLSTELPGGPPVSNKDPVRVWYDLPSLPDRKFMMDPVGFELAFSRLFRSAPQIRRLAAEVLWEIKNAQAPRDSNTPASTGGFLGVQMEAVTGSYTCQACYAIDEAKAENLADIYLSAYHPLSRHIFHVDAVDEGLRVFTKEDLLQGDQERKDELGRLTPEQDILVDLEVLRHSTSFCGASGGFYSWYTAIRRSLIPGNGPSASGFKENDGYRDAFSAVAVSKTQMPDLINFWQ